MSTEDSLRLKLHHFAATASLGELKQALESLSNKERPRVHVHGSAIERRPDTQRILAMMKEGKGVRAAPEAAVASAVWKFKFLAADVAEQLVYENDQNGKATVASLAIAVASVSARVVSTALELQQADAHAETFKDAKIAKQSYKDDPSWARSTTRGSGIVFNDDGKILYHMAVDALLHTTSEAANKRKARPSPQPKKRARATKPGVDSESDHDDDEDTVPRESPSTDTSTASVAPDDEVPDEM